MNELAVRARLLLSLQRALLGCVRQNLRAASIEGDPEQKVITVRFEYADEPSPDEREQASCVTAEVIADFPEGWRIREMHVVLPPPAPLSPLAHIAYQRAEDAHAT